MINNNISFKKTITSRKNYTFIYIPRILFYIY